MVKHTHVECKNYIHIDVDKGMCALTKKYVLMDGNDSFACSKFVLMPACGNCDHFVNPDKYGIGTCKGLEKENWAYSTCGAQGCKGYGEGK